MKSDSNHSWIKNFPNRRFQTRLVGSDFEPHQREFHIFAQIKQGQIQLRYRERNYMLAEGDTILIPAGEIHSYSTAENAFSIVWFHYIDTIEALNASGHLLLPELETILVSKHQLKGFAEPLFESIQQAIKPEKYQLWLNDLVAAVSDLDKEKNLLKDTDMYSLIGAKQYIQDHLDQPFCLEAIAQRFNISKWQLSRQFKPIFGVTLFQHIHASRMVLAKDLLSQNKPITEVALRLSYSDQSHFTRFFKRFVGISPRKWVLLVNPKNQSN